MFDLHAITKTFNIRDQTRTLFTNLSLTCEPGKRYVITGPSGVGKSTLLLLLCGIEEPTAGQVLYNRAPVPRFGSREHELFLCHTVGIMFQYPYLVPEFSVLENVMIKGLAAGLSRAECQVRGRELLAQVGLIDMTDKSPSLLSGGEQQRVALARTLFLRPAFLVADEPTAHLDAANTAQIFDLISSYQQDGNMGVIISSHDSRVSDGADRVFILGGGIKNG